MSANTDKADIQATKETLADELARLAPAEAIKRLAVEEAPDVVAALESIGPVLRWGILKEMPGMQYRETLEAADPRQKAIWHTNAGYEESTIGSLMDAPIGMFSPETSIETAIEQLRDLVKTAFITYGFAVDDEKKLVGVIVMREMLLADRSKKLEEIMLKDPFYLTPEMELTEAMKKVLNKHYPVYPVCDEEGRLVGLVRGQTLFEAQAIEISAQVGAMVGVEKEERLSTPWQRCLKFRHPWLQLNLVTAFLAAAVVGIFQDTIDRIVVLAVFLPVLAGQSGNTGCQALAVALRGMTLGELKTGREKAVVFKEGLLGLLNGALVGITAGLGMFIFAAIQKRPDSFLLGFIVFLAMIGSCVISGVSGVMVPLILRKFGADPATASSIFLTTATDVVSMGTFLGLATLMIR